MSSEKYQLPPIFAAVTSSATDFFAQVKQDISETISPANPEIPDKYTLNSAAATIKEVASKLTSSEERFAFFKTNTKLLYENHNASLKPGSNLFPWKDYLIIATEMRNVAQAECDENKQKFREINTQIAQFKLPLSINENLCLLGGEYKEFSTEIVEINTERDSVNQQYIEENRKSIELREELRGQLELFSRPDCCHAQHASFNQCVLPWLSEVTDCLDRISSAWCALIKKISALETDISNEVSRLTQENHERYQALETACSTLLSSDQTKIDQLKQWKANLEIAAKTVSYTIDPDQSIHKLFGDKTKQIQQIALKESFSTKLTQLEADKLTLTERKAKIAELTEEFSGIKEKIFQPTEEIKPLLRKEAEIIIDKLDKEISAKQVTRRSLEDRCKSEKSIKKTIEKEYNDFITNARSHETKITNIDKKITEMLTNKKQTDFEATRTEIETTDDEVSKFLAKVNKNILTIRSINKYPPLWTYIVLFFYRLILNDSAFKNSERIKKHENIQRKYEELETQKKDLKEIQNNLTKIQTELKKWDEEKKLSINRLNSLEEQLKNLDEELTLYEETRATLVDQSNIVFGSTVFLHVAPKSSVNKTAGKRHCLEKKGPKFLVELFEAIEAGKGDEVAAWFEVQENRKVSLKEAASKGDQPAIDEINLLNCQIFSVVSESIPLLELLVQRERKRQVAELGWNKKEAERQQEQRHQDGKIVRILMGYIPKEQLSSEVASALACYDLVDSSEVEAPQKAVASVSGEKAEEVSALGKLVKTVTKIKSDVTQKAQAITTRPKNLIEVYERRDKKELDSDSMLAEAGKYDLYVMAWTGEDETLTREALDKRFYPKNEAEQKLPMLIRDGNRLWFYGRTPGGMTLLKPLDQIDHQKNLERTALYNRILPEKGYDLVVVSNKQEIDPLREGDLGDNEFRVCWEEKKGLSYRVKGLNGGDVTDFISEDTLEKCLGERYCKFLEALKGSLEPYFSDILAIIKDRNHTGAIKKLCKDKIPDALYKEIAAIKSHSHGVISADHKLGRGRDLAMEMSEWIVNESGKRFKAKNILKKDEDGNTLLHLAVRDNLDDLVEWLLPPSLLGDMQGFFEKKLASVKRIAAVTSAEQTGSAFGAVLGGAVGTLVTAFTLPALNVGAPVAGAAAAKVVEGVTSSAFGIIAETTYDATHKTLFDLEQRINVNVVNNEENTALHIAAATPVEQNLWIVAVLLSKAKPNDLDLPNKAGDTPLHIAVRHGNAHIVSMLLLAGANPNMQDAEGKTPLHLAMIKGDELLLQMLLESGANQHVQTKLGYTVGQLIEQKIMLLKKQFKVDKVKVKEEEKSSVQDEVDRHQRMQKILQTTKPLWREILSFMGTHQVADEEKEKLTWWRSMLSTASEKVEWQKPLFSPPKNKEKKTSAPIAFPQIS